MLASDTGEHLASRPLAGSCPALFLIARPNLREPRRSPPDRADRAHRDRPDRRDRAVQYVGKGEHHATALTPVGKRLHDRALPNGESKIRALFAKLARYRQVLVTVDRPAFIGVLPVTVAREAGCLVA